jgi:hypothetical protein
VVTLDWARSRQLFFRNLLANGIDPSPGFDDVTVRVCVRVPSFV